MFQAAYHTAKPSVLQTQLEQLGLAEDKVNIVGKFMAYNCYCLESSYILFSVYFIMLVYVVGVRNSKHLAEWSKRSVRETAS